MALHPSLLTSAPIAETGPDAALIAACNAFAAHEIMRHDSAISDDEMDVLCERMVELAEPMMTGRATTPEGIAAKARASALYLERFDDGLTGKLLTSLFRDMLGLPDEQEPEPEEQSEPAPPLPPDPADPAPGQRTMPWREQHLLWEGAMPEPDTWAEQALADLPLIRLCVAFQAKPYAEIEEGFRTHPDGMTKTSDALTEMTARYEKLVSLIRGEAMRYGVASYRTGVRAL